MALCIDTFDAGKKIVFTNSFNRAQSKPGALVLLKYFSNKLKLQATEILPHAILQHISTSFLHILSVIWIELTVIRLLPDAGRISYFAHQKINLLQMKSQEDIYRVKSISELHDIAGFEKPKHPLITIIDYSKVNVREIRESVRFVCEFYSVNFKDNCTFLYGRQFFDHKEGTLLCTAPEQIITMEKSEQAHHVTGWGLFFHPEFIRNTSLGKKIMEYTFFLYEENEALHLSSDEKSTLFNILQQIEKEYLQNIDKHSHELLITNLELLLNYCKRFYNRQFITRNNQSKDIIAKFEQFLAGYIHSAELKKSGLPTVKLCAEKMNLSANYLSDLLKSETGKSTQEHIHFYLLDRAKTLLLNTNHTVNEIAFELGFEYPQNLSKLFKNKTGITPTEFRKIQPLNN